MSTPATTAAPRGLKLPAAVRGTQNSSAVRSTQSSISLKGATVSGLSAGLYIDNYNMYDPKNGWVPDGYGNSASNPTGPDNITVLDTWTEFACDSGFATYTTDLTTAGIITHKVWIDPGWGTGNTGGWRVILTCDAFKAVYGITMLTNTFTEQAEGECQISVGLDGNVITTVFDTAPTFAPAPGMVLTYSMQLLGE